MNNLSISNFKAFSIKILLPWLAGVIVILFLLNFVFERSIVFSNKTSGAYKIKRILYENAQDEIPIFGSSRAETGFIPDTLGSNYFNYGISGSKYDVTLFFLEQECRKKKRNPNIILDLDIIGLKKGYGDICNFLPFSGLPEIKEILGRDYKPYYKLPFLKYYGEYESYIRAKLSEQIELTAITNKGALLKKNELTKDKLDEEIVQRNGHRNEFLTDDTLSAKLFSIIKHNPSRHFIFVIAPSHRRYFEAFYGETQLNGFLGTLRSNKNVTVVDMSRMQMDDSMFLDLSHINYLGARYFSCKLRDTLRTICATAPKN